MQEINGLVGWYKDSKASDAIEAFRKDNVKCSREWGSCEVDSRIL